MKLILFKVTYQKKMTLEVEQSNKTNYASEITMTSDGICNLAASHLDPLEKRESERFAPEWTEIRVHKFSLKLIWSNRAIFRGGMRVFEHPWKF